MYRFGGFELNPDSRELLRDGAPATLQPRAFDLLLFLLERRERVVDKDEILAALWPGVHVSETALTRSIMKARRAVDDDAESQSVIKTVHGHGYRFVAEVSRVEVADPADTQAKTEAPVRAAKPVLSKPAFWLRGGVAIAAVIAVGFLLITLWRTGAPGPEGVRVAVLPIQNATGDDELDWVELGLMSFVGNALETSADIDTVSPRLTLDLTKNETVQLEAPLEISDSLAEKMRRSSGASHIVRARLYREDDLLRLRYKVLNPRGQSAERSVVGDAPIAIAQELSRNVVLTLPKSAQLKRRFQEISTEQDFFVAEAYARGRALQLQGKIEEARDLFKIAAEQEPGNIWLRYEYALSTRMMGELAEAEKLFRALLKEAEASNDKQALMSVHNGLGILRWRAGDFAGAQQHYEKALTFAEASQDHVRMGAMLTNLGILARRRGALNDAKQQLTSAMAAYDAAGIEVPLGPLLTAISNLSFDQGDITQGEIYLERALERFQLTGNKRSEAVVLSNLGQIRRRQGFWVQSEVYFDRALAIRNELNDKTGLMTGYVRQGSLRRDQGLLDDAMTLAEKALSQAREGGAASIEGDALMLIGDVRRARLDYHSADEAYSAAYGVYEKLQSHRDIHIITLRQARLSLDTQNTEHALGIARRILADDSVTKINRMSALVILGEAQFRLQERDEALSSLSEAFNLAKGVGENVIAARIASRIGEIHLEQKDLEKASSYLALARAEQPDLPTTLHFGARYAFETQNFTEASDLLERAKVAAKQNWTEADEALLARYSTAAVR